MPIYRFGDNPQLLPTADLFQQIKTDFRSDTEQRYTSLAIHDSDSNDLQQARKQANEMINVSGAEVLVYTRTENADYDHVWDSDPDPTYWGSIGMKAFFKPQPLEAELKKWGVDTLNKTEIVFSHFQLYEQFGERMLRTGDVIRVPYNAATPEIAPKNYRVVNGSPSGNFRYNWLYFTCQCETLTADVTVRPDDDTPMPVDETMRAGGVYYEGL